MSDSLPKTEQERQEELQRKALEDQHRQEDIARWNQTLKQEISDKFEREERESREAERLSQLHEQQKSPSPTPFGNPLANKTNEQLRQQASHDVDVYKFKRMQAELDTYLEQQKQLRQQQQDVEAGLIKAQDQLGQMPQQQSLNPANRSVDRERYNELRRFTPPPEPPKIDQLLEQNKDKDIER